jgi:hypothetical protein
MLSAQGEFGTFRSGPMLANLKSIAAVCLVAIVGIECARIAGWQ